MYETVIIGGGPAGTGSLVWAARHGMLEPWLDRGVAVVERSGALGGTLGSYPLNADSRGASFLECLDGPDCHRALSDLRSDPVTRELERWRQGQPRLGLVDRFERRVSAAIRLVFSHRPNSAVFCGHTALAIRLQPDGSVAVLIAAEDGQRTTIRALSAVLAIGGRPNTSWGDVELAPGVDLSYWQAKIVSSHRLLTHGGADEAGQRLGRGRSSPRAVILGGAHSAFSAAWMLLDRTPGVQFDTHGVQIIHRSDPRPTYFSRADAKADGYKFSEADVCQATGRVHRLGGLQGDGREVWRRMHGKPGTEPDHRVVARPIEGMAPAELTELFDQADLIVPALGYRLGTVPVYAAVGALIPLAHSGPSVDPDSRLLSSFGRPVPGLFGVGLGSGFVPWGGMSGEESFTGQQNSLWLFQNGLGEMIYRATSVRGAHRSCDVPVDSPEPDPGPALVAEA